ncbi:MAG: patatin-like phospholipase family protein [Burkholderiales bacterium]
MGTDSNYPNPRRPGLHFLAVVLALELAMAGCASVPLPPPEHPPRAESMVLIRKTDRPVIAFVLGGGGARGFAHAGVLKVLDEAGIRADLVVGTSAGSLVGAFYAGGIRNEELVETALAVQRNELVDFVFPNRGFIEGNRLQTYIDQALHGRLIEQLDTPFVAVATELSTGRLVAFTRGDTGMAVRASCSVPVVFQPTTIEGREYVDGGLVSPVPVKVAREFGADLVIAVNVSRQPAEQKELDSTTALLNHAFIVMEHALAQEETKLADVVIRPNLAGVPATDLAARGQAIAAGEAAARAALPQIRRLIAEKTVTGSRGNAGR